MLTSGTTGPPKRVDLGYRTLERVMVGAKHYESKRGTDLQLRSGVAIVNSPLVHLGGLFRVLQCVLDGRSFCLLPRFTVEGWADAVRRHRPATTSLVPAALRMVLDADLDPADLASLRSVISGTAPLDPDDADAFTTKYGVPVLVNYAATEFGGGVAGWNVEDHRTFWSTKRGSVGHAHPGCELRVVDPASGEPLGPDAEGVLEVQAGQLGEAGWVRTTDLARIDPDGFVWILGRADQAIIRGGFKVLPDDVRAALERHPAVLGACVVGLDDRRLGAVPVAVVELRSDASVTPEQLLHDVAPSLARYELPTELRVARTSSPDRLGQGRPRRRAGAVRGLMTEPWTFGVAPLPQTEAAAAALRRVTSLLLSLEQEDDAVARLLDDLRQAEAALAGRVPTDPRAARRRRGRGRRPRLRGPRPPRRRLQPRRPRVRDPGRRRSRHRHGRLPRRLRGPPRRRPRRLPGGVPRLRGAAPQLRRGRRGEDHLAGPPLPPAHAPAHPPRLRGGATPRG